MKSTQRKTAQITTSWTKGTTTNKYQSKPVNQPVKTAPPTNYGNRRSNPPANNPKTTYNIAKNTPKIQYQPKTINQPAKINNTSNTGNRRNNPQINIPKKDEKPKYQNSRVDRHLGDTETKVVTKQEGDYLIKVTTTRKVIDKGTAGYGVGTGYSRGYNRIVK